MLAIARKRVVATVNKILEAGLAPWFASALASAALTIGSAQAQPPSFETFAVPTGSAPHDVAPAPDGAVWYTAQAQGAVGRLDPRSGRIDRIPLGAGSAPHGVIVGPDRAAWVTDGGQNAIVRVDPKTLAVTRFQLPKDRPNANLNTAVFDKQGHLWFTGQSGIYGELDPQHARMRVFDAPRGPGPYGICVTPDGGLYSRRWPGVISVASIPRAVLRRSSSRQRRIRARAAHGPIRRGESGSASGTQEKSAYSIPRRISGANGVCPATIRTRTPFL
ncbi:virginiamycin B lyase [Paraburkholderia hospita]|nr:virginiamycin B lyase [Paraburkholderia hospita]